MGFFSFVSGLCTLGLGSAGFPFFFATVDQFDSGWRIVSDRSPESDVFLTFSFPRVATSDSSAHGWRFWSDSSGQEGVLWRGSNAPRPPCFFSSVFRSVVCSPRDVADRDDSESGACVFPLLPVSVCMVCAPCPPPFAGRFSGVCGRCCLNESLSSFVLHVLRHGRSFNECLHTH